MSLITYKLGQGSIVLRVKILDSSVSTGAGLTGLTFSSSGLVISTIADNEASATTYTAAGSTIETITTIGTYAAPTATKCRFKEVDSINHPGVYEIQIADARFNVSSSKSLLVSVSGATNAAETDVVVPLTSLDPYDGVRAALTALPNAAADAAGGLPISDAGGLDMDAMDTNITAIVADTNELQTDWANGGRLDLIIDAILVDTAEIGAAGAGLTDLGGFSTSAKAEINAEVVDTLQTDTPVANQTIVETLRRIGAITSGIVSGAGTGTETFQDYAESSATIVITADVSGNRSAITYNS